MKSKKKKRETIKYFLSTEGHFDEKREFLSGAIAQRKIGITERAFQLLGDSGEFERVICIACDIVKKESFFNYLNRVHRVAEKDNTHTEVPILRPYTEYAKRLGVNERTFVRECNSGVFDHYRIGSLYKMSEEDYCNSLKHIHNFKTDNAKYSNIKRIIDLYKC